MMQLHKGESAPGSGKLSGADAPHQNYHHIIPKSLYTWFSPEQQEYLEKYQVKLPVSDHEMVECFVRPIVYLVKHGIPFTNDQFVEFLQFIDFTVEPYRKRLRGFELLGVTCSYCDYTTTINPRSNKPKRCRHCKAVIFLNGTKVIPEVK